jgi:GTPase SAR1 family protein
MKKSILIIGGQQSGKSSTLKSILNFSQDYLIKSCDDNFFESEELPKSKPTIGCEFHTWERLLIGLENCVIKGLDIVMTIPREIVPENWRKDIPENVLTIQLSDTNKKREARMLKEKVIKASDLFYESVAVIQNTESVEYDDLLKILMKEAKKELRSIQKAIDVIQNSCEHKMNDGTSAWKVIAHTHKEISQCQICKKEVTA